MCNLVLAKAGIWDLKMCSPGQTLERGLCDCHIWLEVFGWYWICISYYGCLGSRSSIFPNRRQSFLFCKLQVDINMCIDDLYLFWGEMDESFMG